MLTPADIENRVFKKTAIGGYDIKDVESFLEEIIDDYDSLFKEALELKDKCENLQESVCYYKSLENGIEQTITNAKEEATQIKERAEQEFESLRAEKEAEFNVEMIGLKNAIKQKELELEETKNQMEIYKLKVKSMLEAQLDLLEGEINNE